MTSSVFVWNNKNMVDKIVCDGLHSPGQIRDAFQNKTKSLKSREEGELKSKRWMMIKVDWWLKSIDDSLKLIDEIVLWTN